MIRAATFNAGTFDEEGAKRSRTPSLLSRFVASLRASRERAASQEIARYIELNGGELTDALEREISRRYGRGSY